MMVSFLKWDFVAISIHQYQVYRVALSSGLQLTISSGPKQWYSCSDLCVCFLRYVINWAIYYGLLLCDWTPVLIQVVCGRYTCAPCLLSRSPSLSGLHVNIYGIEFDWLRHSQRGLQWALFSVRHITYLIEWHNLVILSALLNRLNLHIQDFVA